MGVDGRDVKQPQSLGRLNDNNKINNKNINNNDNTGGGRDLKQPQSLGRLNNNDNDNDNDKCKILHEIIRTIVIMDKCKITHGIHARHEQPQPLGLV